MAATYLTAIPGKETKYACRICANNAIHNAGRGKIIPVRTTVKCQIKGRECLDRPKPKGGRK